MAQSPTGFGVTPVVADSGPIVLYPRAVVVVEYIYNDGSKVSTALLPSRVSVVLRPHHQCGTCEVEFSGAAVPFDLRRLNGVFLSVYMGAVSTIDGDVQADNQKNLQFVGYADTECVKRSPDGTNITITARDLSALLRNLKPMYVLKRDGVELNPTPMYTDTVIGAASRILDWAGYTKGQFEFLDLSGRASLPLTSLVDEKGIGGFIPTKGRDVSAWEAIEHTAGVADTLVSVDLGKIVFRSTKDSFPLPEDETQPSPKYSFIFGKSEQGYTNTYAVDVTKKFVRNRRGVTVSAVDPVSRKVITADYPTDSALAPRHAPKLGATKQSKPRKVSISAGGTVSDGSSLPDPTRDVFNVGGDGVHSKDGLQRLAERIYRERAGQEMEGTLTTYVWDDALFSLRNADRFEIKVKPELEAEILNRPDEAAQADFLREHFHVNDAAARTMLAQIRGQESTLFYVRSIHHEWTTMAAKTTIDFVTLIVI